MKSIIALYTANAREFIRDRMASLFTIIIPVMFAAFFGMVFGGSDSGFRLNLGLVMEDAGPAAQQFEGSLTSPEARKMLSVKTGDREQQLAALEKGELQVVLVLPSDLTQSASSGQQAAVEVFYDPARQSSSGVGLGMARNLLADANLQLRGQQPLLVAQEKPVLSRPLRPVDFYVPSVLAMSMLWLGLFGTMMPLVQQREQQVLRRLGISPVSRINLLWGQVSWRLTVGLAQAAVFVLVGALVLGLRIQDNWLQFAAASVLGSLMFISMGYLLAGLSATTESAAAFAQIINFPMMFLSGIFFEIQMLPEFLRPVATILPPTYLADAFRQIMVGYSAIYPLWLDFTVLFAWTGLFFVLGLQFFRWEQR